MTISISWTASSTLLCAQTRMRRLAFLEARALSSATSSRVSVTIGVSTTSTSALISRNVIPRVPAKIYQRTSIDTLRPSEDPHSRQWEDEVAALGKVALVLPNDRLGVLPGQYDHKIRLAL